MITLFINDKIYATLAEKDFRIFLGKCAEHNLKYIITDENSCQLLPCLQNKTFLIESLENNSLLDRFIQNLSEALLRYGAKVLVNQDEDLFPWKISFPRIALGVYEEPFSGLFKINVFFSRKNKAEIQQLFDKLTKKADNAKSFSFSKASFWKHLISSYYYSIISSPIPSILFEFPDMELPDSELNDLVLHLLSVWTEIYCEEPSQSELQILAECLAAAMGKKISGNETTENIIAGPVLEIDEIRCAFPENTDIYLDITPKMHSPQRRRYVSPDILSHSSDKPVNYFVRPSDSTTLPIFPQNFIDTALASRQILVSTFRKPYPLSCQQKQEEPAVIDSEKAKPKKSSLESIRNLENILKD